MCKDGEIEIIARAVIIKNGKMLLCRGKADDYYFFPGGHMEFGEKAEIALLRELVEEIGVHASRLRLIGILENRFTQKGRKRHEINFVYHVTLPTLRVRSVRNDTPPFYGVGYRFEQFTHGSNLTAGISNGIHSAEDHIEFVWIPLARLGKERVLPKPLHRLVMKWMEDKKFFAATI